MVCRENQREVRIFNIVLKIFDFWNQWEKKYKNRNKKYSHLAPLMQNKF